MPDICLYFQVHQPDRLLPPKEPRFGSFPCYEDDVLNAAIFNRVADQCYLPANAMFQKLIEQHSGRFRIALSLSGTVIGQMQRFRPDVLVSFQNLVAGGGVELLAETFHHSIAFIHSNREFDRQVELHLELMEDLFQVRPRVFRNSELIYNDAIAAKAETMGFDGIIAEGVEWNLRGESPNYLYRAPETARIKTLPRHIRLSDDLGFRLGDSAGPSSPLTPEKFCSWVEESPGDLVHLFLGYESIGEHQRGDSGVFQFWENLPVVASDANLQWVTPSEAVDLYRASREYPCRFLTSWTDGERDLSAWIGNSMQREVLDRIHSLEKPVHAAGDPEILHLWAKTQTSNHFHWMSTKGGVNPSNCTPLIPYRSPADAFERLMSVLDYIEARLTL